MAELTVNTDVVDARWERCDDLTHRVEAVLQHAYEQLDEPSNAALTVRFSDAIEVQVLNRDFRQKDAPTNVLSFPDGSEHEGEVYLGDVIIAYDVVAYEAQAEGKAMLDHATHMALHGCLHLLGFDHETDTEAEGMEALEISILAHFGIESPYA